MVRFSRLAARANYPVARVANLLKRRPQYGANERGLDRTDVSQMRYVRITDVDSAGRLVPGLGATAEVADNRYLLNDADILLARSGNTAGKSYMYSVADGPAIFAGYMIRFAFDPSKIVPAFAFIYTQLPVYHLWVQATRRLTGQPNINAEEYRSLTIPIPPVDVQRQVIAQFQRAMTAYNQAEAEAAALLASIDDYLLSELGIVLPPETENTLANRTFRVSAHELGGWRFDPHALHPYVEACREAIERLPNSAHLRQVVSFSRDQVAGRQEPLPYVGLEHVQGGTGILLDVEYEEDFGSALMFEPGHVLFPKLRPYLNKVHLADTTGYCSTEFHVLQAKAVSPEFLTLVLRSEITVRQTKHLMTGNTLPRLQTRDIERLPIPIPDKDIQDRIVTYSAKTQSEAVKLTQSAITELESAKREIEAILLESPEQVHQPQNSFALG